MFNYLPGDAVAAAATGPTLLEARPWTELPEERPCPTHLYTLSSVRCLVYNKCSKIDFLSEWMKPTSHINL